MEETTKKPEEEKLDEKKEKKEKVKTKEKPQELSKEQKEAQAKIKGAVLFGFVIVIIWLAMGITCLVLSGYTFRTLYATWSEGPWYALAPCSVAAACTVVFVGLVGIIAFCFHSPPPLITFMLCDILSLLFSFSIAIFALIGGVIWHKIDGNLGCETKSTGIMKMWDNVDVYLKFVDSLLCSDQCPCEMTKRIRSEFENDQLAVNAYKQWKVVDYPLLDAYDYVDLKEGVADERGFSFRKCSEWVKNEAELRYIENSNSTNHWINRERFANYWNKLERRFNCTGFCKTSYIDPYTNQPKHMLKFLFSDVNMGVPKYPGCLSRIMKYIPNMTISFGAILLAAAILQTVSLILAIKMFSSLPPSTPKFSQVSQHD